MVAMTIISHKNIVAQQPTIQTYFSKLSEKTNSILSILTDGFTINVDAIIIMVIVHILKLLNGATSSAYLTIT